MGGWVGGVEGGGVEGGGVLVCSDEGGGRGVAASMLAFRCVWHSVMFTIGAMVSECCVNTQGCVVHVLHDLHMDMRHT